MLSKTLPFYWNFFVEYLLREKSLRYKAGIKIILQMLIISDYYLYLRYKFILKITSYFDIISLRQYNFVAKNNSPLRIYY